MNKLLALFLLLGLSFTAFSQVHFGIASSVGASRIIISDNDPTTNVANYFKPLSMCSFDFFIIEKKSDSRLSFEQTFSLETTGSESWLSDKRYEVLINSIPGYIYPQHHTERSLQITIPLKIKYDFEKWLIFHAGISNAFYFQRIAGNDYTISRVYALRGVAGVDFMFCKKLFAGINYAQDLNPCGQASTDKIYYHFQSLSLRIGYILK